MQPDPDYSIEINDTQTRLGVDRDRLVALMHRVLELQAVPRASLSISLVDDATIRRINREHLDHDWPTDVITFPLSEPTDPLLSAELVVSAQMAAETAAAAHTDPLAELVLYLVHGLLHLTGYDDGNDVGRRSMRRREAEVLAHLDLPYTFDLVPRPDPSRRHAPETPPCSD